MSSADVRRTRGAVHVRGGVLFDVDGTLLLGSVTHLLVLGETLTRYVGRPVPIHVDGERPKLADRDLAGYVDVQCAREALAYMTGAVPSDAEVAEVMARYAADYAVAARAAAPATLVPGARDALERLHAAGVRLGLITGNASFVARAKMAALGLDGYFRFDPDLGFGDWRTDRAAVAAAAVAGLRADGAVDEVAYVGDTPRDMHAARAAAVRAVGVLSGAGTEATLAEAGADVIVGSVAELFPA